ncbi:hypothetical protein [Kribbella sp. HUAS MG21]|uniref:Uncharacterized protein n=1 Tax=Kribbella sp. HUAS MG21 TaxID=3160966 RepID=A0AAU7THV7_9ACTN
MKRFVVPPNWPSPPRRNWIPPKSWRPDPSWPPAPNGWRFWVDGKGYPVLGPIGRYGGPPRRAVYAGSAALLVLLGVNIWAVSAIGLFGGGPDESAAVRFTESGAASPGDAVSSASPVVPGTATASSESPSGSPSVLPTGPRAGEETRRPTRQPTRSTSERPTRRPTATRTAGRTSATPKPTRVPTRTASPRPSRPTPSTRDELLRQYCIQQGIDPAWCDPGIWSRPR